VCGTAWLIIGVCDWKEAFLLVERFFDCASVSFRRSSGKCSLGSTFFWSFVSTVVFRVGYHCEFLLFVILASYLCILIIV